MTVSRTSIKINSLCATHDVLESWALKGWLAGRGHDGNVIFTRQPHRKDMANSSGPPFVSLRGVWQMYCLLFAFSIYFFIPFFCWLALPQRSSFAEHLSSGPPLVARPWIFRVCPVLLHFGTHILLSSKVDKGFARTGSGQWRSWRWVCHFVK